jgi:hypothetical protein
MQFKSGLLFLVSLTFLAVSTSNAQNQENANFRSPLDIPLFLAGNFGELRSNHFHTGIDIKTQGVEGKAVYAVEDGYVARIKISTSGYGKAIYIRHPNGYTTVYAHLQKGNTEIEKYIQTRQYLKESFAIELFPGKTELPVKKGEMIARAGNSGSSGGPHLHFEIRETTSEEPVNPLLFNFQITDNIKPIIKGIRIYPLNEQSYVSPYPGSASGFIVDGSYGKYRLSENQKIQVYGDVGLAVHTYDLLDGYPNKCEIYKIKLIVDSTEIFEQVFEKLNFSTLRYVNTYTDYALLKKYKMYYHKQYIGRNNELKIYPIKKNNGEISFTDGKPHAIEYVITDTYSNQTKLKFTLEALSELPENYNSDPIMSKAKFSIEGPNFFMDKYITIDVPPFALYDDMDFDYKVLPALTSTLGSVYQIGDEFIPLQKNILLTFNVPEIPTGLENKTTVIAIDDKGKISSMGGKFEDEKFIIKTRSFGKYGLAIDTIAPKIDPVNIFPNKDLSTYNTFSVKISDNLAGIKTYRGTIDNQWILMEYEPKKSTLTYRFDNQKIKPGKHLFELEVSDGLGNKSSYSVEFIR